MTMTNISFAVAGVSPQRRVEWWALLNSHKRPADVPRGIDQAELFRELDRTIPRRLRMDFWTGAFRCGLAADRFT